MGVLGFHKQVESDNVGTSCRFEFFDFGENYFQQGLLIGGDDDQNGPTDFDDFGVVGEVSFLDEDDLYNFLSDGCNL